MAQPEVVLAVDRLEAEAEVAAVPRVARDPEAGNFKNLNFIQFQTDSSVFLDLLLVLVAPKVVQEAEAAQNQVLHLFVPRSVPAC